MNLESIKICIQSKLETLLGVDLPRQGIIAGEGLAVLVLSSLWSREISVNRIDLYKDWPDEAVEVHGPIHYSRPSLDDDSYHIISQNGFSVLSSSTNGILTAHVIQRCQANLGKDRTMAILHALNLNAFGVGYAAVLKSNAGKTRIFHIDGMSPSTAATYYIEDSRDVTFEVYGHSNRDALPEHLIVAERLGSYLINAVWNKNEPHDLLHNA